MNDGSTAKNASQTFFEQGLRYFSPGIIGKSLYVSLVREFVFLFRILATFDGDGVGLLFVDPRMGIGGSLGQVGQVAVLKGKRIAPLVPILVDFAKSGVIKISRLTVIRPNRSDYPAVTDFMHGLVVG
jgi:hypothetical protein